MMEEDEEVEAATELVTREVKMRKVVDATALQKALEMARDIEALVEALLKEPIVEATHKVIEQSENLQQLVVAGDVLNDAEESKKENATCPEVDASEATRGNHFNLYLLMQRL